MIKLSKRLEKITSYVLPGENVIDVGTDHGYIPVYLAQRGLSPQIWATDINANPLHNAQQAAALHGVGESITFSVADGLAGAPLGEVDTVIISGMGGEMIASILSSAHFPRDRRMKLVLQPQSKLGALWKWLEKSDFAIIDTDVVVDREKRYTVIVAQYYPSEDLSVVHCKGN